MPINGMPPKPPMTSFGMPNAGAMNAMGGGGMMPGAYGKPLPPSGPFPVPGDPAAMGLPPGAVLYDDGSVRVPAEFAQKFIGANQTGGANPLPPGLPPEFGNPGGMFGGPLPPGMTPPPPVPPLGATMPGQPSLPPTDPASLAMAGPPPPPPPKANLSVPGGASITDGMPMAAPMPSPDYKQADVAGGPKATPKNRLAARGKSPAKGKKG